MTGTLINVGAVLVGTLVGTVAGARLGAGSHERVLFGLGMVTLILGIDNALAWREAPERLILVVMFPVLLGGVAGELLKIEDRLQRLGDRLQQRFSGGGHSTVSEAFFTATLVFCVGPHTILGSIDDGFRGDIERLTTKSLLDGFASIALAAISVLVVHGAITLKLLAIKDVKVGNDLPALLFAPPLAALAETFA